MKLIINSLYKNKEVNWWSAFWPIIGIIWTNSPWVLCEGCLYSCFSPCSRSSFESWSLMLPMPWIRSACCPWPMKRPLLEMKSLLLKSRCVQRWLLKNITIFGALASFVPHHWTITTETFHWRPRKTTYVIFALQNSQTSVKPTLELFLSVVSKS